MHIRKAYLYIESFLLYNRKKNIVLELDISYLSDMFYMIDMFYMSYHAGMSYQDDMLFIYMYMILSLYTSI